MANVKMKDRHYQLREKKEIQGITITHHEGAAILSISKELPIPYEKAQKELAEGLENLANWVDEQGGLVGHIKGYITEKMRSAMLTTTGSGCHVLENDTDTTLLDLTVIVFMVDEQEICEQISSLLNLEVINDPSK